MMEAGVIVLTAFISPFIKDRNIVRELVADGEFIEVYCDASLNVCELRDVKGLYKKSRVGEISEFTGISSPYEMPIDPEILLNTENQSIESSVNNILAYLRKRQIITINHS